MNMNALKFQLLKVLLIQESSSKASLMVYLRRTTQSTMLRCFKITEKVSFNIASEASYSYILSGQKFIKNAKKCSILASFWKPEACGQTVLPDRSVLIGQKLVENGKIQKFKCDILSNFQTMWTDSNHQYLISTVEIRY